MALNHRLIISTSNHRGTNSFVGGRIPLKPHRAYPLRCARETRLRVSASAAPPKRVAVVGGGPAGLTFALALSKLNNGAGAENIQVFEQYGSLKPTLGAGFNINGGAAILCKLGLDKELKEIGNPMQRVLARTVTGDPLFDVNIPKILPDSLKFNGDPVAYTVMRSDLQAVLESKLPEGMVRTSAQVIDVFETGMGVRLRLADGSTSDEFDLVVGCDGIRSLIRAAVTNSTAPVAAPVYSGIRILFAVAPLGTYPKADPGEVHQWFGDGAYALAYSGGKGERGRDMLALCVADGSKVAENEAWAEGSGREQCTAMLQAAAMPEELVDLVGASERIFDIGVHYHNTLPRWTNGSKLVLLGDSAHAMPPFMGQGANQAIQDAYCLAEKLGQVGGEYESMEEAIVAYEKVRQVPTAAIMQISRLNGWIETQGGIGATLRDLLFKVLGVLGIPAQIFLQNAVPRV